MLVRSWQVNWCRQLAWSILINYSANKLGEKVKGTCTYSRHSAFLSWNTFCLKCNFFPKPSLIYQTYTTLISMRLRLYGDALLLREYDKCEMWRNSVSSQQFLLLTLLQFSLSISVWNLDIYQPIEFQPPSLEKWYKQVVRHLYVFFDPNLLMGFQKGLAKSYLSIKLGLCKYESIKSTNVRKCLTDSFV